MKDLISYENCWYKPICDDNPKLCGEYCEQFRSMADLVIQSDLPKKWWFAGKMEESSVDKIAYEALEAIRLNIYTWVKEGNSLYICSSTPGNGKTRWASRLLLSYFNTIWPYAIRNCKGKFVNVPELLAKEKQFMSFPDKDYLEYRNLLKECDLVVWDDIGATPYTSYTNLVLTEIIDTRLGNGLANIYTSNITETQYQSLKQPIDKRLFSRIYNASNVISFRDQDRRGGSDGTSRNYK